MALRARLRATLEGLGAYLIVLRKRFAMTLHILGIAVEEADNQQPECKANPIDQFWLAASDVLIEIVQRQPDIHTSNQSLTPRLTRAVTSRSPRTIKVAKSRSR